MFAESGTDQGVSDLLFLFREGVHVTVLQSHDAAAVIFVKILHKTRDMFTYLPQHCFLLWDGDSCTGQEEMEDTSMKQHYIGSDPSGSRSHWSFM